jgi:hypothetical protein
VGANRFRSDIDTAVICRIDGILRTLMGHTRVITI